MVGSSAKGKLIHNSLPFFFVHDKGRYRAQSTRRKASMTKQSELGFMGKAIQFPSLSDANGIMPWDPNQLDIWAAELGRDRQAVHAARFMLELWHLHFAWECGTFDPKDALECWDRVHRHVFLDLATKFSSYSA